MLGCGDVEPCVKNPIPQMAVASKPRILSDLMIRWRGCPNFAEGIPFFARAVGIDTGGEFCVDVAGVQFPSPFGTLELEEDVDSVIDCD